MDRRTKASRAAKVNLAGKMFFLSSHVLSALAATAVIPILPAIGAAFHDTPNAPALTRALLSAMSLAMMVGSLCAGFLGERIGTRPVLFAALAVYAAAGGLGAIAPSLGLLLVSRVVLGLASSIAGTLVVALVAQTFARAERDRWMGWIAASAAVGSLVCIPLAGVIGNFGWRYVFLLFLVSLPLLLLAMIGIERAPAPILAAKPAARLRLPLRAWQFVPLAIGIGAVVNATPMFLPFYLAESGIDRPSMISTAMLCSATTGVIAAFFYGTIRRWLSMPHIFVMTFTFSAAGLALVSHAQSYEFMLLALALSGLGLGLAMPNLYAVAATIGAPAQTGKIIGLAIGCFFMGGPLLQAVLEFAVGGRPAWVPLTIVAALSLVLALIWLAMTPVFREDRATPTVT